MNHSCDPNAYVMMDGAEVSIRTLKPIEKDEEILISYIDTTNPLHRRQNELQARWFFTCKCSKCSLGATATEDGWADEPRKLSKEIAKVADKIVTDKVFAQDTANRSGDSVEEKRISALEWKAFEEYEQAQRLGDAVAAIRSIEDAMRLCHQSGLWLIYRQPFAALRDDLIINLLSEGQYTKAWAQCAKRYRYILPKLYPTPSHPVRVVQTWQMAMLAAYLASSEDGVGAPGVNMGLIAMMLVKQVMDVAVLSHGPNSAFTKSVKQKAEEMMEELRRSIGNPNPEVMNRELEVQRDMLMEMGDWTSI